VGTWGAVTQCKVGDSNWNTASNWGGKVPSGATSIATFGAARVTTINYNTTSTVGTLSFTAQAPAYTFNIGAPYSLTLAAEGIRNLSSTSPVFNVSGRLNFVNGASAGNAKLVANQGGIVDFSGVTSGASKAGSIDGAGTFNLGKNTLEVGSLNTSTTLSGAIRDGGAFGGVGGSLKKVGSGKLTLTASNTYTGTTTVAGTLEVSGSGRIDGTSAVTIAQNAADSGTLRVTGAGARVITRGDIVIGNLGNGTLTLDGGAIVTARSVFLGTSAGSKGTLNIGVGGVAGVLDARDIFGGAGAPGVVNINHNQSAFTLASSLRGALVLNHNGTGTTTLTGELINYSGGTNLNAGTVRIYTNTALGISTGVLNFNGGTLQAMQSIPSLTRPITLSAGGGTLDTGAFTVIASGEITGTGRLTKAGSGTLILTGTASFSGGTTVLLGTLRGNANNLKGSIVNHGTVSFAQLTDGTYSGAISGTGRLEKGGSGNLTLTGAHTFMGGTSVAAGTLTVLGSLSSDVMADDTLAGTGTIHGAVTVLSAIAPGNGAISPIGTLTVNGNLTLGPASVYRVDANAAGDADRINVSGNASLGGAAVEVIANPAGTYQPNTRYTILSAAGGLNGEFSDVTTDLAFLTPTLSSDTTNVYLTLTRNDTSLTSVAATSNELATARYMQALSARNDGTDSASAPDSGEPSDAVLDKILKMSALQARTSFAQLSGSGLTQLSHVSRTNTSRLMDEVSRQMLSGPGTGLWARSLGTQGELRAAGRENDSSTPAFEWRGGGVALGTDTFVTENTLFGASLSYTNSMVALNSGSDGQAQVRTPQAMLYAGRTNGNLQLRGVLGYALNAYTTERNVTAFGDLTPARSEHEARELSAYAEAAYSFAANDRYELQPLVGLRYAHLAESAFTETGAAESLAVAARRTQFLTSDVGLRLTRAFRAHDGALALRAVWSHELADTTPELTARLAGDLGEDTFTVTGTAAPRDRLLAGVSFTATLRKNISLQLDYNAELRTNAGSQQFLAASLRRTW
jgi:T5SS/PEP-CTERM-associated repeat protein/autotransporter-associated beta strand protein